jgi:hypothetical protein
MDSELFDISLKAQGGRLKVENLPSGLATLFSRIRFRAEQFIQSGLRVNPSMPPVYFDFVDNPSINAFATKDEYRKYIGLTDGAVMVFHMLFARLMADPRVLSHIGNISIEQTNLPPLSILPKSIRDWTSQPVLPHDPLRREVFHHLTQIVLDFLVGHEFTHLVNGHVDYLSARHGIMVLDEKETSVSEEGALIRQTLEWDADCIAVCHAMGNCVQRIRDLNLTAGPIKQFYRNPTDAFLLVYFAISAFFRIFGDVDFTEAGLLKSDYPPMRHRQVVAMGTATTYIMEKAEDLMGANNEAVSLSIQATEPAFANIIAGAKAVTGLKTAIGKVGSDHSNRLRNFWKTKLRSDLEPFAYHTLPE